MQEKYVHPKLIISKILRIDPQKLDTNDQMNDTIGWDSFSNVEIMLELEKIYQIEITQENFEKCMSLKGIICLLKSKGIYNFEC